VRFDVIFGQIACRNTLGTILSAPRAADRVPVAPRPAGGTLGNYARLTPRIQFTPDSDASDIPRREDAGTKRSGKRARSLILRDRFSHALMAD